ncbi:hypothetical protein [Maricaulis alexandrii]|uniref:hypothetical protein n=1 Tax=Maricaulis alexandrii TaxID=2570354 RepID=UPI001108D583|nr:hypothetical protein [Maricaulis alexandrii]
MRKLLHYIPVALIASLTVATPLLAAAEPARGPEVAVVFPPGWSGADAMRAAARADVGVVRFGAWDNILITRHDSDADIERLRDAGAWFILPPGALGGCLAGNPLATPQERESQS